jgi:molecular chaperone HtpG
VLLMTDPVDEWVLERLREFDGKPLVAIDRGELDLEGGAEKDAREALEREHRELLGAIEKSLAADVKTARFSSRLTDSPAVLVNDPGALSPQMERLMRAARQEVPHQKRILELNPEHPQVRRLIELHAKQAGSEAFSDAIELLHGQALLAEGSPLPDGARFARLVSKLATGG